MRIDAPAKHQRPRAQPGIQPRDLHRRVSRKLLAPLPDGALKAPNRREVVPQQPLARLGRVANRLELAQAELISLVGRNNTGFPSSIHQKLVHSSPRHTVSQPCCKHLESD